MKQKSPAAAFIRNYAFDNLTPTKISLAQPNSFTSTNQEQGLIPTSPTALGTSFLATFLLRRRRLAVAIFRTSCRRTRFCTCTFATFLGLLSAALSLFALLCVRLLRICLLRIPRSIVIDVRPFTLAPTLTLALLTVLLVALLLSRSLIVSRLFLRLLRLLALTFLVLLAVTLLAVLFLTLLRLSGSRLLLRFLLLLFQSLLL